MLAKESDAINLGKLKVSSAVVFGLLRVKPLQNNAYAGALNKVHRSKIIIMFFSDLKYIETPTPILF